ncbi:hypothetical protein DBY65_008335 [Pseudomonas sp. RIT412]|nr:hypothetical protein DBY65_008335 [Pseudomonas sp. RIT 412]
MALTASGSLPSGAAPWARRGRPSMAARLSRLPAAQPTPRHLRSACTQVAFGGGWAVCVGRSKAKSDKRKAERRSVQGKG